MGKIDNTPTGRLIKNIFLSFAEFERDMIVQRTSEGKAIAKMNNPEWREGRKKEVYIPNELIYEVKAGKKTVASACRELGISRASWYNEIKKRRC